MTWPLFIENTSPGGLISNLLASCLIDMPNSLTAQKQNRPLASTFRGCFPLDIISRASIP